MSLCFYGPNKAEDDTASPTDSHGVSFSLPGGADDQQRMSKNGTWDSNVGGKKFDFLSESGIDADGRAVAAGSPSATGAVVIGVVTADNLAGQYAGQQYVSQQQAIGGEQFASGNMLSPGSSAHSSAFFGKSSAEHRNRAYSAWAFARRRWKPFDVA